MRNNSSRWRQMTDTRSPAQRRRIMQSVQTRDTGPELAVRKWLHARGYRYRLHSRALPGSPDIVFPSRKVAIFVHGCFWHGHTCPKGRPPKTRADYWLPKIEANRKRDRRVRAQLRAMGWRSCSVWQCQLKKMSTVTDRLEEFLNCNRKSVHKPRGIP